MSWPPPGVDRTLNEKLPGVFADAERAEQRILTIGRDIYVLTDENDRRVSASLSVADLLPKAEALITAAHQVKQPTYAAIASMLRGIILLEMDRAEDALSGLNVARADWAGASGPDGPASRSAPERVINVQFLELIARAQMALKDPRAISKTCGEAIEEIERDRYKTNIPYLQSAFLKDRASLYGLGVYAAFQLGEYETMLERAELSKARATLRRLGDLPPDQPPKDQLQQQFQEVCRQIDVAGSTSPKEIPESLLVKRRIFWDLLMIWRAQANTSRGFPAFRLDAVKAALDDDEAVVYYYWLGKINLLIIGIDRHEVIVLKSVMSDEKRAALEEFANFVSSLKQGQAHKHLDTVQRFSSLLLPDALKPILGTKKKRVIISPHRLLHAYPFHALQWDGDYVIRRFAVSYTPNLSGLLMTHAPTSSRSVLALGIKDFVPKGRLEPLKDAEREVDGLDTIYRERGVPVDVLKGPEATKPCLQRWGTEGKLEHYRLLHFATHGANIAGDNPMESYLSLQDAQLDGLEITDWRLNADLVVLSACCSGQRAIAGRGLTEAAGR